MTVSHSLELRLALQRLQLEWAAWFSSACLLGNLAIHFRNSMSMHHCPQTSLMRSRAYQAGRMGVPAVTCTGCDREASYLSPDGLQGAFASVLAPFSSCVSLSLFPWAVHSHPSSVSWSLHRTSGCLPGVQVCFIPCYEKPQHLMWSFPTSPARKYLAFWYLLTFLEIIYVWTYTVLSNHFSDECEIFLKLNYHSFLFTLGCHIFLNANQSLTRDTYCKKLF